MYFFFILFFISLAVIIFMISRKLLLVNNSVENIKNETLLSDILDFDRIKHLTIINLKKASHTLLWIVLKTYIISSNFINKKRKELVEKIKSRMSKRHKEEDQPEKKEVSKHIKIISEYRQKIRNMTHRIKEEEGIE